ncbi:wall-associated receptor kinase, galacturonan-binding domain-containing protein [Artemisia annua]|uniref:Wall-associated receptor kinase, galacturonan-binding domain-containing protein n=1 Tax=Artemisia annua TaxID=35608 RepID=A0A2U1MTY1_ARTAN|nr:wall-associated receptor kinase, galacturonan-binding domain-containing protein [Artemisia annua]
MPCSRAMKLGHEARVESKGTGTLKYAKPGFKDTCGNNVVIPYPFGIGASCSLNEWYTVECNSSKPYLAALDHLQLVGVDLKNQTVTVNMPKFSDCGHTSSVDLGSSPFLYSKSHNKLVYEGYCCNVFMMDDHGSFLTGCFTACYNDTTTVIINAKNCFGINCCQTTIPHYLKSYRMSLTALENHIGGDGGLEVVDQPFWWIRIYMIKEAFLANHLLERAAHMFQHHCCGPFQAVIMTN